ncbi:MAG: hypothetical protein QM817_07975 [Archangium sp.]
MARFAAALESNPAPSALGDIGLRFEPSMLIGETPKARTTIKPTAAWVIGIALLLFSAGVVVTVTNVVPAIALAIGGALFIGAGVWVERLEKRQRRFVANFMTNSLRLDFSSPLAGYPRTLVIPFDDVSAVELLEQDDGKLVLVVDFELQRRQFREALAAWIPADKRPDAERLQRVLHGAFGLGEAPADSPAFDPQTTVNEESSFEP